MLGLPARRRPRLPARHPAVEGARERHGAGAGRAGRACSCMAIVGQCRRRVGRDRAAPPHRAAAGPARRRRVSARSSACCRCCWSPGWSRCRWRPRRTRRWPRRPATRRSCAPSTASCPTTRARCTPRCAPSSTAAVSRRCSATCRPPNIVDVAPPDPTLSPGRAGRRGAGAASRSSRSTATRRSAAGRIEGCGFVYAPQRMLTNAHVVAGTDKVDGAGRRRDAAGHRGPLRPRPRRRRAGRARARRPGAAVRAERRRRRASRPSSLGYPEDGPYTADSARIRVALRRRPAHDIYGSNVVTREIYAVRGDRAQRQLRRPAASPTTARCWGIVFATALDSHRHRLTCSPTTRSAATRRPGVPPATPVGTGSCTPG